MEFCRFLVVSIVFIQTSPILTSSTREGGRREGGGIPPQQQQQQQQQRPLLVGRDGDTGTDVLVIDGGGLHHQQRLQQQQQQQQSDGTTSGRKHNKKDLDKQRHKDGIMSHVINYLNISVSQLPSPLSSPSSFGDGKRQEVGRRRTTNTMHSSSNDLRRGNFSRTVDRKHKIISYGEKVSNLSDNRVVQFSLREATSKKGGGGASLDGSGSSSRTNHLSVTEATISVLFRRNKTSNQRMGAAAAAARSPSLLRGGGGGHHPRRHTISVYVLKTTDSDGGAAGTSSRVSEPPVAYLTVSPKQTRWLKVLLPTSVAQAAIDSDDQVLRLLITCDTCRDGDEVVTLDEQTTTSTLLPAPLRRPPVTRSLFRSKKGGRQGGGDRRSVPGLLSTAATAEAEGYLPYLVVHTKVKPRPVVMTTAAASTLVNIKTTRRSGCRKMSGC